jgi:hypothetical protein
MDVDGNSNRRIETVVENKTDEVENKIKYTPLNRGKIIIFVLLYLNKKYV